MAVMSDQSKMLKMPRSGQPGDTSMYFWLGVARNLAHTSGHAYHSAALEVEEREVPLEASGGRTPCASPSDLVLPLTDTTKDCPLRPVRSVELHHVCEHREVGGRKSCVLCLR